MVALLLSAIGKTGPILWSMSGPANQLLRQLGLLLFLAEVGTSAGKNLVATFQESGLLLFGVGAAITLVPMLIAAFVGRLVFKISLLDLLGTITGGMTSTPGLAAADSMVDSNIPECSLCDGISDCNGIPDPVYTGDCDSGVLSRLTIKRYCGGHRA